MYVDEELILSSYYEDKYNQVLQEIKQKESDQFKQSIYEKLRDLNQDDNVKKQKDKLILKKDNKESISIIDAFTNYKEYIFSNKPIFMINIESIPLILNRTFENYFDYVLICPKEDFEDIYNLSVLYRTKNKLISVEKGE